jgi:hypothetical protein
MLLVAMVVNFGLEDANISMVFYMEAVALEPIISPKTVIKERVQVGKL